MFDVVSFGSAILDNFIKSADFRVVESKEFDRGQALALPHSQKCQVDQLTVTTGGGGTNTAVGFARLGLKAAVVARCGWDQAGRLLRRELKKEGVDDSLLIQLENEQTDQSFVLIGPDGLSTILVYRGQTRLEKNLVDFKKLASQWFCLSNLEGNLELLAALVAYAQKNKIKVALNPGRREIEQKERLLPLIKNIDLLVVNKEEAAQLTATDFFDSQLFQRSALLSQGLVAVTQGKNGVFLFDQKDRLLVSAGFKTEMVDSTGAGDGFFCGLVTGLIKNWDLKKALKLGVANGASTVTAVGAKTALLYEKHIHNWLEKPIKMDWKE